ncbi:glutathione peroxidase [Carnobacterium pleistocenium]|uniref:glutathione peroxidase n=1 Tax=Carnobacterium pleistocenium TaxID=181073 RepID=UPI0005544B14|nr:glutathione peroxidase [Carnobacterium pleistocenium]
MSVYEYTVNEISGEEVSLSKYKGNVLVIVNTATECGLAPQLKDLEELYQTYKDQGLVILGFPSNQFMNQEPREGEEIANFCQKNFGVSFQLHEKIMVNGKNADPLYQYLTSETNNKKIKWNFTKFLIGRDGEIIKRFGSTTQPQKMEADIAEAVANG